MNQIEFGEDQLNDLGSIAQKLFQDTTDPRSRAYKRILVRPTISWGKIAGCVALFWLAVILSFAVLLQCGVGVVLSLAGAAAVAIVLLLLCAKRMLICLVRIYQRYAPDAIRNKCRFEPSCSQYMILSLQKYGLWRGLKKGIGRLKRCNPDGGGYDMP